MAPGASTTGRTAGSSGGSKRWASSGTSSGRRYSASIGTRRGLRRELRANNLYTTPNDVPDTEQNRVVEVPDMQRPAPAGVHEPRVPRQPRARRLLQRPHRTGDGYGRDAVRA